MVTEPSGIVGSRTLRIASVSRRVRRCLRSAQTVETDHLDRGQGAHIAGYALPDLGESLGEREQNAGSRTPRSAVVGRATASICVVSPDGRCPIIEIAGRENILPVMGRLFPCSVPTSRCTRRPVQDATMWRSVGIGSSCSR